MNAILHFDGSYRPVPDDTCFVGQGGWHVIMLTKPIVLACGHTSRKTSSSGSTEAEADGLIAGLRFLVNVRGLTRLQIVGDCQPVLDQLNQWKQWKDEGKLTVARRNQKRQTPTAALVRECFDTLNKYECQWTTRKTSRFANALAHMLAQGNKPDHRTSTDVDGLTETAMLEIDAMMPDESKPTEIIDGVFYDQPEFANVGEEREWLLRRKIKTDARLSVMSRNDANFKIVSAQTAAIALRLKDIKTAWREWNVRQSQSADLYRADGSINFSVASRLLLERVSRLEEDVAAIKATRSNGEPTVKTDDQLTEERVREIVRDEIARVRAAEAERLRASLDSTWPNDVPSSMRYLYGETTSAENTDVSEVTQPGPLGAL